MAHLFFPALPIAEAVGITLLHNFCLQDAFLWILTDQHLQIYLLLQKLCWILISTPFFPLAPLT